MRLWPLSWGSASALGPQSIPNLIEERAASHSKQNSIDESTIRALLEPFRHSEVPSQARAHPSVEVSGYKPVRLAEFYRYLPFFASEGFALTKAFISHHVYGPPLPSWGVEMTLFTNFLREAAKYSHLSSIERLRGVLELGSLLPLPTEGMLTPISFPVKRRSLRGFLADVDAEETGKRLIHAEWVINRKLWSKMQRQFTERKELSKSRVILYLHGGAYYVMSAETHRFLTISVSKYTEMRVFSVNYRLAPETKFPGQLHDAVSAYMRLIEDLKIPPQNIIFAGDSAGAGLCLSTMMYLRDEGYPLPSGAILMSPWVDLTMSCESWTTNRVYDYLPFPQNDHLHPVKCLLGDNMAKYLTHPYVSPLFGNFQGLPPMLIQAGNSENLRDEITLLAHKAAMAGVKVEHEIYEDCVHVFQMFLFLEASRRALQSQHKFVKYTLNSPDSCKPSECTTQMDLEISSDARVLNKEGEEEPVLVSNPPDDLVCGTIEEESSDLSESNSEEETPETKDNVAEEASTKTLLQEITATAQSTPTHSPKINASSLPRQRSFSSLSSPLQPFSKLSLPNTPSAELPNPPIVRHSRSGSLSSRVNLAHNLSHSITPMPILNRQASHPDFTAIVDQFNETGPFNCTTVYYASNKDEVPLLKALSKTDSRTSR